MAEGITTYRELLTLAAEYLQPNTSTNVLLKANSETAMAMLFRR